MNQGSLVDTGYMRILIFNFKFKLVNTKFSPRQLLAIQIAWTCRLDWACRWRLRTQRGDREFEKARAMLFPVLSV